MNAVIDEDLPKSFGEVVSSLGFSAYGIRNSHLRGASDEEVFRFAQEKKAVLFTGDLGFSNILRFTKHYGIVVLRYPNEMSTEEINKNVSLLMKKLSKKEFQENLIIVSPGKIRIRRLKS